jgi:hypothetical protein
MREQRSANAMPLREMLICLYVPEGEERPLSGIADEERYRYRVIFEK